MQHEFQVKLTLKEKHALELVLRGLLIANHDSKVIAEVETALRKINFAKPVRQDQELNHG